MAAACAVRLCFLFAYFGLLSSLANVVFASPTGLVTSVNYRTILKSRGRPGVIINDASGHTTVFNSQTQQPITQGAASDGGGSNFDASAILWIVFSFFIGVPLSLAGIRGWRFTIGAAIGLAVAVCTWAAFVNTVPSQGVPDIAITAIVLGIFVLSSIMGFFDFGRIAGLTLIGVIGGIALGVRVMMFKTNLLINSLSVNWLIIVGCGASGVLLIMWKQRAAITLCTASAGLFLVGLGVDLCLNKQNGMSRGLRFLFDRNTSHLADILSNDYTPSISTKIILGISLVLIPPLAFIQHKIFRDPFDRSPPADQEIDFDPSPVADVEMTYHLNKPTLKTKLSSRFSHFSTI